MSKTKSEIGDADSSILLHLLNAVEQESKVTQRGLASELGIALGMANSYLKRCVRKGLIKVRQAPANRYRYYLTPKGFTEKARLTGEYMSASFTFFRRAKEQCAGEVDRLAAEGKLRIGLAGVSELAEVSALCGLESTATLIGVVDRDSRLARFAGLPVVSDFEALDNIDTVDAILITDVRRTHDIYQEACARYGTDRVRAPSLLGLDKVIAEGLS